MSCVACPTSGVRRGGFGAEFLNARAEAWRPILPSAIRDALRIGGPRCQLRRLRPRRSPALKRAGGGHIRVKTQLRSGRTGPLPALMDDWGPLAQRLEHRTHNPLVVGSNPTGPTKKQKTSASVCRRRNGFVSKRGSLFLAPWALGESAANSASPGVDTRGCPGPRDRSPALRQQVRARTQVGVAVRPRRQALPQRARVQARAG